MPKSFAVARNKTAQNHAADKATSEPPRWHASGNNACLRGCKPCRCRKRERCDGGGGRWWGSSALRLCKGKPPAAVPLKRTTGPHQMARHKEKNNLRNQNRCRCLLPDDMHRAVNAGTEVRWWAPPVVVGPVSQNFSPRNATSIKIPLQET